MNINDFIRNSDGRLTIPVPKGIRYLSEWGDFDLEFFGRIPFIIDKQIPGCGFTEYCLTSKDNIILASPRVILLDNKQKQHVSDVHFAKNECEDNLYVDKDTTKITKQYRAIEKTQEEIEEEKRLNNLALQKMEERLMAYCMSRQLENKPLKIIVTYDSFKHVKRFLQQEGLLSSFKIVVDEFQSIFVDSRFKASTEFGFLEELKSLNDTSICFVSATPMIDKYLRQLDYFDSLPYFELNWEILDPGRVMKPELKVRKIQSVNFEIKKIIREYKEGKFSILSNPITGEIIQSKEAVFYVNSVNNILSIIKSEELKPDEVNILCSDTTINKNKIKRKLGVKFKIGTVPLKGEPHKMFTFCTRTVYLGADFYSLCARTFVFSDANIDSLAVDISLDLPQILGRQRLIENPWKNHAEFFFKNLGDHELTKKDFDNRVNEKNMQTDNKLSLYQKGNDAEQRSILKDFNTVISSTNYKDDYVSITYFNNVPKPVRNMLVIIAEQRAYDIQQIDYKDRFTVFSLIKNDRGLSLDKMSEFINHLRDTGNSVTKRLKELCETTEFTDEEKKVIAQQVSENFDRFYNIIGPERCKALAYNVTNINREIKNLMVSKDDIKAKFQEMFEVGKRYTNKSIKEAVGKIYIELGITKNPKATDINNYFRTKTVSIITESKEKINGLEILEIKE